MNPPPAVLQSATFVRRLVLRAPLVFARRSSKEDLPEVRQASRVNDGSEDQFQDMEALLQEEENSSYRRLHRGDVVEGTVMGTGRDGVLVNIGTKSEGIIPPNEMQSLGPDGISALTEGEIVVAYVLQPETEEGQVLLSLDRARGEQGWRVLQKRFEESESFEALISGYNKGGLLVSVEGVNAFIPLSQLVGIRPPTDGESDAALGENVGRSLRLKVIEINRRRNRVILSERAALQEWRSQQRDLLLSELAEGTIRQGKVTSIRNFGVFIDLGGADGLVHLSELSWDRNSAPEELFQVGQEVDVYVMKVDPETKKIALSIRRAQPQQWDAIVDEYQIGQIVAGQVTKLVTFGAFARLDGPVEGLIHVSELADRRIQHPREVVDEGDVVPLKVVRIERDRHRLGLSLRGARDEAERADWTFDGQGTVIAAPAGVAERFGGLSEHQKSAAAEAGPVPAEAEPAAAAPAKKSTRASKAAAASESEAPAREPEPAPQTAMAAALQQAEAALQEAEAQKTSEDETAS